MPGFLNLRRLEGRIVALFLALLLVVQLASFLVIQNTIERNADRSIAAELKTGERVFRRLLVQVAEKRADAAALLAQDYGFKQAIGLPLAEAGTVETIQDALANQGERIGASVVAYLDTELKLVAATRKDAERFIGLMREKVTQADARPAAGADALQLTLLDGQAYQFVAAPVRTPGPVGWVLMGFALDEAALRDLKSLSDLQGVVVVRRDEGPAPTWTPLVASLDKAADSAVLATQIGADAELFPADVAGEHWRGRLSSLEPRADYRLGVVLLRSFDQAVAPYRALQLILLALTLLGVAVFALSSVLLARRISRPIQALSESAVRLGRGDYDTPVARSASNEVSEVAELAASFEAMRESIRVQTAKVERLAYWDELTGLPNSAQFRTRLDSEAAPFAVLMLDLDRFKSVNDVLGHEVGDELLKAVSTRLQALAAARGAGMLARLAGDEFALLLPGAAEADALHMAQAISQDFKRPLLIHEHLVDIGAGIGIVLAPLHGQDAMQLLSRAELAMYAAKQRQSGSMIYDEALDVGSPQSLSLLSELRNAIAGNELRLYLQPKVDFRTGAVHSAEALVRWLHPSRGLVPPMQFIPFAEQTGFITELTRWVLAESARAIRQAAEGGSALRVSVNLSTRDLLNPELLGGIGELLARHGAAPASMCLEITESAIMDDPQRALATLGQLKEMGFRLSIDDFGTGYSSLAYLKHMPVDELKIDKSFVMAMERDLDDAKIVRSTIDLAHNLGLSVVAEGVETGKAWALLRALGCDEGQGYFIGKPMPQAAFFEWLAAWQAPDLSDSSPDSVLAGLQ